MKRSEPYLAIRLPIMPHISFRFWSGRMNSASLACDSRREKSIRTMDWCMSFETFESKNSIHFVPQLRFGMPGGVDLLMLYFISVLFVSVLSHWLSTFEREIRAGGITVVTIVTVVTVSFHEVTIPLLVIYIYLIYK